MEIVQKLPNIGIHKQVDFQTYRAWPALCQTDLKQPSPLHMKASFDGKLKKPQTTALRMGSAIHCYLLEADFFDKKYPVAVPCEARLKSGPRKGQRCESNSSYRRDREWFCGQHANGAPVVENRVSPSELFRIKSVAAKIQAHPIGRDLRAEGENEISMLGTVDDILMKGRFDRLQSRRGMIIDAKKIVHAKGRRDDLQKKIRDFGYDIQAYTYRRIYESITGETPGYLWLFFEDEEPFDIIPKQADELMFDVGKMKFDSRLRRWKTGLDKGHWDGCGEMPDEQAEFIGPSAWEVQTVLS